MIWRILAVITIVWAFTGAFVCAGTYENGLLVHDPITHEGHVIFGWPAVQAFLMPMSVVWLGIVVMAALIAWIMKGAFK